MPETPARPRQVTWSAAIISVGSLIVLATAWQVVAGIGSLETREGVEEFLSEAPGDSLGLGTETALEVLRVTAMVAAALAVTAAILGWQVLQRSRSARVVLSVLALPIFAAGTVTGGLVSAAVVASIITLWLSPAREWYAGLPIPEPPARRARAERSERSQRAGQPGPAQQQAVAPVAQPGPGQPGAGQPAAYPASPPPAFTPQAPVGPGPRPPALLTACLLVWSFSGLTLLLGLLSTVVLWSSPDLVTDAVRQQDPEVLEQGLTVRDLQVATTVVMGVLAAWCVAASTTAAFAMRGSRPARTATAVSTLAAAVVSFAMVLGSLAFAVPFVGCLVTLALLRRPEVRRWP